MFKLPHIETNAIPSRLNTDKSTDGVMSQMSPVAKFDVQMDGVTIEQMQGNPIYERGDTIDKVGKVQKKMADNAKIVKSRQTFLRKLNNEAQRLKPQS